MSSDRERTQFTAEDIRPSYDVAPLRRKVELEHHRHICSLTALSQVMANVLCQIRGSKRLVLYPPSDVTQLQFPAGASSSILDVFDPTSATRHLLTNTHPYEAILHPGDVLFIPPCWAHIASPTDGISIAVNVFFRNLKTGYAAGKDVYGNRDLWAYERGRINVGKIAKAFEGLPIDIGKFYLERLAEELKEKAHMFGSAG